jgi:hypothetical protein
MENFTLQRSPWIFFNFTHESLDVFPSHLLPLSPFCLLLPCSASAADAAPPGHRRAGRRRPPPALPLHVSPGPSSHRRITLAGWTSLFHVEQTPPSGATPFRRASVTILPSLFNSLCPEVCEAIHQPSLHFPSRPRIYPRRILAFCFNSEHHRRLALVDSFLPALWVRYG